jgi:hypothetical protein
MSSTGSGGNLINTGALLRAGGIGLAAGFVFQIISAAVGLISASAASGVNSADAGTVATTLGGLLVCLCCVLALLYAAIGAGYSWFAEKSGGPVDIGPMALGGALAAFVDGILLGICGVGVNYLTNMLNLASQSGSPAFGVGLGATFGLPAAGLGLAIGVCVYPFIYAILGAAGAAIYAALASNRSKPQPAAT